MKIAVLSDIHAHWVALQAVAAHIQAWQPDAVVVGGDHVNRGPRPRECWEYLQERARDDGWLLVRGNHDEYVIGHAGESRPAIGGPAFELFRSTIWTCEQLNNEVADLERLPFQVSLNGPDGSEVRVVHASMLGTRNGMFPHTTDDEIREKMQPPPQLLCVGHTHRPFVRQIDGTLVVNVGSVGLPFDGDSRLSYAQLTWRGGQWQAEIIRLEYDHQAAKQDFYDTGYTPDGGPLTELVLDELNRAGSNLANWVNYYEKQILAGEISMAESVQSYFTLVENGTIKRM